MAKNPRNLLQRLTEVALDLCRADTVGISILNGDIFRWEALAGVFSSYRNGTMPRDASPCGICIDRNATQLMSLADRCFPALRAEPQFVEVLLIPFHDHGVPVGTIWIVAHSNERKFDREDERIVRSLAQFASAGWQMVKAAEAAVESNRSKDEFIAVLSHELRNPIGSIRLIVDTMAQRALDEDRLRACIQRLDRQTASITRIVDDIRDLSRLVHRKLSIEREQIDLCSVIGEVLEERREQMDAAKLVARMEILRAPVTVFSDRIRLKQILDNLLSNAIKFGYAGGMITVCLKTNDHSAIVQISDNGRGFDAVSTESIFEPFVQIGQAGAREHEGLGLGLAISKQLLGLLGGTITAHSDGPGRGATFTVTLPNG
jgi:signal transduction histidine kinase